MKQPNKNEQFRQLLGERHIGFEARTLGDDHPAIRIWLRLLACSTQIEHQIRDKLRVEFGTTLPRFDYMAQLYRSQGGLKMKALTHYLMVSGGNVTSLTKGLVESGLVERVPDSEDGRSYWVRLSKKGKVEFERMAARHEQWLTGIFHDVPSNLEEALYDDLGQLRILLSKRSHT